MITPNKVITLDDSVLSRLGIILGAATDTVDVISLYGRVSGSFESVDQFLLTLDTLFVLGRIHVNLATRELTYVT